MKTQKDYHTVFLGLGSNLGDRMFYLVSAIEELKKESTLVQSSSVYETLPYGKKEQPNFLNAVIELKTEMSLHQFLEFVKSIEHKLGRKLREKWDEREIDLDILFYDEVIYSDERVTVPHPDIVKRDFVLKPLCEIAPKLLHPVLQQKISSICLSENEHHVIAAFSKPLV